MPLPVSVMSIMPWLFVEYMFTSIDPLPSMASTAFFMRFSITHSVRGADIFTGRGLLEGDTERVMRRDMRVAIYSAELIAMSFRSPGSIDGREPILENLAAMVERRVTSLFISATASLSIPMLSSSSIHAMREDIGVPS